MLRYENKGQVIEIRLPNKYSDYSVECRYMYIKSEDKYSLSMWLKKNTIDDTFRIDSQEIDTQYIPGTRETIRQNICRIVEQACSTGFFDKYVERFEYTYDCFEIGNEALESKNITKKQ